MKQEKFDFYSPINLKSYNLDQIMRYQLDVLERLDPFTRRHSENVANLCCRICEYLRCKQSFTVHCTIGGYLHDVGKMFIPLEILNKPARLTPEEYEVMKTHTTLGYQMCMKDPKLRPYALAALDHHEALDGSGYPSGLTKKDIPYEAQIIRVADEYDALVTKRQYRTHVNISETLKELIKDAQPDPKFVALDQLAEKEKSGKISGTILKKLFKVVIDDTLYEISCIMDYVEYLKQQIKRLELIQTYQKKADNTNKQKTKDYYQEGMRLLFQDGETFANYNTVLEEYKQALHTREAAIEKLYLEIKIIKKLRV
jgi:hypothetical protein